MNQLAMGSKTPVSILQEMLVKKSCPPQYDLIYDGGGTHEAYFKYKVHAGGITAIGSGRSKKEAKHDAAKNALERLAEIGTETPELDVPEDALDVASPYKDKIQENAVGALQDVCAVNECPFPEYELVAEQGPPHSKIFTYRCSVSKHSEIGIGRTKKQAKQVAANKMLVRLKSLPNIVDCTEKKPDDGEELETEKAKMKFMELSDSMKHTHSMSEKLSDYHNHLQHLPEDKIDAALAKQSLLDIKNGEDLEEGELVDEISLLEELLESLDMDYCFEEVKPMCKEVKMVLLRLGSTPESVTFGSSHSEYEAKKIAARRALEYFDVMCRKVKVNSGSKL